MVEEHPDATLYKLAGTEEWIGWDQLKPGAMFWDTRFDNPKRLAVKLPSGVPWLIDRSWKRTGEPPNITVTPSINHQGKYHGHLQNGYLTDDCEGRVL